MKGYLYQYRSKNYIFFPNFFQQDQHDLAVFELEQLKDAENRDETSDVTIPELEKQLEKQAAANIDLPEQEANIHSEEKIPVKV